LRSLTKSIGALKIETENTERMDYLEPHCIFNVYSRINLFFFSLTLQELVVVIFLLMKLSVDS
jgi:hypothetical protein